MGMDWKGYISVVGTREECVTEYKLNNVLFRWWKGGLAMSGFAHFIIFFITYIWVLMLITCTNALYVLFHIIFTTAPWRDTVVISDI